MVYLTEDEYKEWFIALLGDIESLDKVKQNSPFANVPKPFDSRRWYIVNGLSLLICLVLSMVFAYLNSAFDKWYFSWLENATLSISLGLLVSLVIFIFTNLRERNVVYYTDIIPLLKDRYDRLHKAYYEHIFKLSIYFQKLEYQNYYDAWYAHVNVCFKLIEFYEYLLEVFPYKPKSFHYTKQALKNITNQLLETNNRCQSEFFSTKIISKELYDECYASLIKPDGILADIEALIVELEQKLYVLKYSMKKT